MKAAVLLTSVALLGFLGCNDSRTTESTPPEQPSDKTAATKSGSPAETSMSEADRALAQRVEEALRQDATLASAAQAIQVSANKGAITLRGSVNSEQEKTNLEAAAQRVAGVEKVNNELEVASASR